MTAREDGLRVAVVGATGTLGSDLLSVLEARRFPLAQLIPVATERSMGRAVEIYEESIPVETDPPSLRGLNLVFLTFIDRHWAFHPHENNIAIFDIYAALLLLLAALIIVALGLWLYTRAMARAGVLR